METPSNPRARITAILNESQPAPILLVLLIWLLDWEPSLVRKGGVAAISTGHLAALLVMMIVRYQDGFVKLSVLAIVVNSAIFATCFAHWDTWWLMALRFLLIRSFLLSFLDCWLYAITTFDCAIFGISAGKCPRKVRWGRGKECNSPFGKVPVCNCVCFEFAALLFGDMNRWNGLQPSHLPKQILPPGRIQANIKIILSLTLDVMRGAGLHGIKFIGLDTMEEKTNLVQFWVFVHVCSIISIVTWCCSSSCTFTSHSKCKQC